MSEEDRDLYSRESGSLLKMPITESHPIREIKPAIPEIEEEDGGFSAEKAEALSRWDCKIRKGPWCANQALGS